MKITEELHQIRIDFEIPVAPNRKMSRFVNVLLFFSDTITLVDTGIKGSEKQIFDYIAEHGRSFNEIDKIILSHSHPDHIGSAARIKDLTGCKILAHKAEQDWIENIDNQFEMRPVPGFYGLVDSPVKVDDFINHGDRLDLSDTLKLDFIHSPGHSAGSLNIWIEKDQLLFTADSIPLDGDIPNYDNFKELLQGLNKIKSYVCDTMLTSWTPLLHAGEIEPIIQKGEGYLQIIDKAVKKQYKNIQDLSLEQCKQVIEQLNMPVVFVNPIVDRAFRSHLM